MSDSKQYKVTYVRGADGTWSAAIKDPEGAATEVGGHSFRTAKMRVRKAVDEATASDSDAAAAELIEEIDLPSDLMKSLASLRKKREMLDMLEQEVKQETLRLATVLLSQFGLALRDAAPYVGLSFQ